MNTIFPSQTILPSQGPTNCNRVQLGHHINSAKMILLQRKNLFLCTVDAEDKGAFDLSDDNESEEVVPAVLQGDPVLARNAHTWYPATVVSQAGICSKK